MPIETSERTFVAEKAELLQMLDSYHRHWNRDLVGRAFDFTVEAHSSQWRESGEPYFTHPLEVARILTELKTDYIGVVAGLLHDVVEDSEEGSITIDDIQEQFGEQVALLVDGVTKISSYRFHSYEEQQSETIRKMLLTTLKDLRVILIKFADRLHNMRTLSALSQKSQLRIARETNEVYAPLAHRLGVAKIARELEDMALKVLDPKGYEEIEAQVSATLAAKQETIEDIINPVKRELNRLSIPAQVYGRVKSISSVYDKIHKRGRKFEEILDLIAIRIIVPQKSECYRALGLVHDLFTPISEHFADYIALPKSNLYQALHTKVRDRYNRIFEFQIRSEEMDAIAENGIAAHWRYKEGHLQPDELDEHFEWIRNLMEVHREGAETGEFMESLKVDLFQDEIFVFTPNGKLIQLPCGATTIDFAFAIHSDVGLHAIGAKVGGKVVPLNHVLESGDTVQILTSPKQRPAVEWLRSARTSRARSLIKRWIRETRREEARDLGREMIEAELTRLKLKYDETEIREVAVSFGYSELADFFAAVGSGEIVLAQVMRKLVPRIAPDKETLIGRIIQKVSKGKSNVRVGGLDNLVMSIAACCNPLPGDPIIGFQTTGEGVAIHRTDCDKVARLLEDERKVVSVAWDVEPEDRFKVRMKIIGDDRMNLLRDITQELSALKVNINFIKMRMEQDVAVGDLTVEVRNLPHLTKVINRINKIRGVLKAERRDIEVEPSTSEK